MRGPMFPQIQGSAEGFTIQNEYLNNQAFLPKEQGSVGLSLTQMIYNDRLISNYRSSNRLYESDQHRISIWPDAASKSATPGPTRYFGGNPNWHRAGFMFLTAMPRSNADASRSTNCSL